ncbi:MAG: Short-chain dehydrogenase/reductase SDR [Candidatus Uhrbacteria bacterium GW2011_GWE2_40_58]|nr:MAG: Short-chain dehydrogenase/reductase SDR [Candidatus Uhrbacteria bacterium GW2011_GWF2_40_263]KKR67211.1 MAG: Short-chain dehydrogenase/reductase SDR [Candidatus Uhrbacteria bacterium GW2011_GWE2_40_58]
MLRYEHLNIEKKRMELSSLQTLFDLHGKVAIVTGGAMGIGYGIAYRLAEAGASVMIADLNEEAGIVAVTELKKQFGKKIAFVKTNVGREEDVMQAVDQTVSQFGRIDILVNNAGIYPMISVMQITAEDLEKIFSVNVKSAFFFIQAVAKQMIKQGEGGKIINITSIDALHPSSVGLAVYDASKHGLWGLTKNVALELAPHHIQVNAIAPGGIATPGTGTSKEVPDAMKEVVKKFIDKIPMKRMGEPDEIGKVALFLASDLSSYMTGSQIVVDGGVLLS